MSVHDPWAGTVWEDVARERRGEPCLTSPGPRDDTSYRTAVQAALADAAIVLWRDLWGLAYGPCPHCGRRRHIGTS